MPAIASISADRRQHLARLTASAGFGAASGTVASALPLGVLLHDLGSGPGPIVLLGVASQGAACLALPVALLLRGMDGRRATLVVLLVGYACLAPMALLVASSTTVTVLAVAIPVLWGLHCVALNACAGPAGSWFRSIVPTRLQGRYQGLRNGLGLAVAAILTPLVGWLIELGRGARVMPCALILAGAVLAAIDLWLLSRVRARPLPLPVGRPMRLAAVLRHPGTWRPAIAQILAGTSGLLSAPCVLLVLLEAGLGAIAAGIVAAGTLLFGAWGTIWGGQRADRRDPTTLLARAAAASLPIIALTACLAGTAQALPAWMVLLGFAGLAMAGAFAGGVATSTVVAMQFRLVADGSPGAFAAQASLAGIGATALGLAAAGLAALLEAHPALFGQVPWTAVLLSLAVVAGIPACLALAHWSRVAPPHVSAQVRPFAA